MSDEMRNRGTALSRRTGQSYILPTLLMTLANVQLGRPAASPHG